MVWWWSQKWFLVYLRRFHLPSSCGTPRQTVRADWRIIPYSIEIHWRYQNYRHDVRCDVLELSDAWTGFTRFILWNEKPHDGFSWSGRDWRGNKRPQDPTMCGQICGDICLMHQNAKKSTSGLSRNQSSIMPEDCVAFTSLILVMRNSRISWRMLVESWKFRCQQQCLVKLHCAEVAGKPAAPLEDTRQKYTCIVEADEFMRIRMDGSLRRYHGDHIAGKGMNSLSHCNLVYSYVSSNENTRYKGSSGQ